MDPRTTIVGCTLLNIKISPDKIYEDFDNMNKTLYHYKAYSDSCRLEKLFKKVKYFISVFTIITYVVVKLLINLFHIYALLQMICFQSFIHFGYTFPLTLLHIIYFMY